FKVSNSRLVDRRKVVFGRGGCLTCKIFHRDEASDAFTLYIFMNKRAILVALFPEHKHKKHVCITYVLFVHYIKFQMESYHLNLFQIHITIYKPIFKYLKYLSYASTSTDS